jgi:hypothetical protein
MNWTSVKDGLLRWQPREDTVYECERVNYRSKRYFARINGLTINTKNKKVFRATLEECKIKCAEHFEMNHQGGEAP